MIRAILRSAFYFFPPPLRQAVKAVLPGKASRVLTQGLGLELPRVGVGRQIFDPAWYTGQYPDAPKDSEEAYRHYLDTGLMEGRFPSPLFENVQFPSRARIPQKHLHRVTASPILCRVPPARYLEPFRNRKYVHRYYSTWEEYFCRAMTRPDQIRGQFSERDLRIAAVLDNTRKGLAADYASRPQDTLISIIMPTRNRTGAIPNAIVSVMMQSYENWELIVVDDAGEDRATEAVVKSFDDARIRYVRLVTQAGIASARNIGVEHSAGHVIAYLDDEGQWDPDFLLVLFNQMRDHRARASYCAEVLWDTYDPQSGIGYAFKSLRFGPFNRSLLENVSTISAIALIHEKALFDEVGPFDASLQKHVDWDLVLRLTEIENPVAVPCLLSHSFWPATDEADAPAVESDSLPLSEVRSKLVARSPWSQPFVTADGIEHLAFSTSRCTLDARQGKLSRLPIEPVQILIPNYESLPELEMCLRSIVEHTPSPHAVLVIDNGSSDETYAELERLTAAFEAVRLIKETSHAGFSFAVNRGLTEVIEKNQNILILNNDTLVTPHWLDELRYVLHKHGDVGMAVPRQVLPANSKLIRSHMPEAMIAHECDINLSGNHENVINPEFDPDDGLVELSYAPLFCSLVRPETMRAAGFLDSANGPHFLSDWILCDAIRRLLKQKIVYTPHSKVYHLQGIATRKKKVADKATQAQAIH